VQTRRARRHLNATVMSAQAENLVPQVRRAMHAALSAMQEDVREPKKRLAHLELDAGSLL
jgi:hypothetical protein